MSETATSREIFRPYCTGKLGADLGFGGDAFLDEPTCLTFDMPQAYTSVGQDRQILKGSCTDLSMFCDGALEYIHTSHLGEDFHWHQLRDFIVPEWRRVLRPGGLLLTNCPWQQKYLEVNRRNGTMHTINLAHKEQNFGLDTWNSEVMSRTGSWEIIFEEPNHGEYSWLQVARKI